MTDKFSGNARKWLGLAAAVLLYYIIHEGSHLVIALCWGVFESIRLMGIGVQIAVNTDIMTDIQTAVFSVSGCASTLITAYLLVLLAGRITKSRSKLFKSVCYYTTLAFLLCDPVYLCFLYRFFGGGDMNGILLFGIPEIIFQLFFAAAALVNVFIIVKRVYPLYKASFEKQKTE